MAKPHSSDEFPRPAPPASSPEAGKGLEKGLSPEREVILFGQVRAGASASETLTGWLSSTLHQHIASCMPSPLATEALQEALDDCIRSAIAQQSLRPIGHVEFCELLGKAARRRIEELIHDQDFEVILGATDWIEQVCDDRAIQATLSEDLWEFENEWEALAQRERAMQEVIASHLPLAEAVAKTKTRKPGEFDDLVQEAVLILSRLIEKFDPTVGVRFCAYAKQVLLRELRRQYQATLGLTRHSADQVKAVSTAAHTLAHQRGRYVTADEVHELLGHSAATRREVENVRRLLLAERSSSSRAPELQQSLIAPDWSEKLADEEYEFQQRVLLPAFRSLSGLEKRLVVGLAIRGQSIRDLAKRYHKNHATISRLYKAALELLAKRISPHWLPRKPR